MTISETKRSGKRRRWLIIAVAILIVITLFLWAGRSDDESVEESSTDVLTAVTVATLNELAHTTSYTKLATLEPAVNAPLIARTGGRITELSYQLGDEVTTSSVVAVVDGSGVANPGRAQVASAGNALTAFESIRREAIKATENGVALAQLQLDAARAGKGLTTQQVTKAREQADLSVRNAELNLEDAEESKDDNGALVRSADIALKAAQLAQDQATIGRNTASRQTSDAVKQAEKGLESARLALSRLEADLSSQRVALTGQLAVARESVRLAQVITPVSGQVTRLTVREGDFVRPGQQVGEVTAFEGARVTIDVATGVRNSLNTGQELTMSVDGQEFTGLVSKLADGPSSDSSLWQVEVFVSATPSVVQPGALISVHLPIGATTSGATRFIPLDTVTVRQGGTVLFTVSNDNMVKEHVVEVIGFTGDFVEGVVEIPDDARVVVTGNRLLRDGQMVTVLE